MKTKPATAAQIRNGQLVVAGFFVGGWELPGMYAEGGPMVTNPRFIHNGDFVDPSQPIDIDVEGVYQGYTRVYDLEMNQLSRNMDPLLEMYPPLRSSFVEYARNKVLNHEQIDYGLRAEVYKVLHPETWYPRSRGTVSKKQAFEGQKPVKDVVVIGGGGGFRRGEFSLVSASTREGQSFNLFPRVGLSRVIGRPISNGLSSQDLADWTAPIPGRYIDFSGILGEPTSKVMSHQYQRLKALAEKNEFRAAEHVYIPGKHY